MWRDFFQFIPYFKLTLLINLSHHDAIIAQRTAGHALHLARQISFMEGNLCLKPQTAQ
ncbi:MAG: hypothetical protein MHPDNHAH_00774 [Anaerolineales bacterium]|nr:hypothetical protein [Anaerolineales bacterium]